MDDRFFEYRGTLYPSYLKQGNAADHIIPFARRFCAGTGLDIGGTKECHFPGARTINVIDHDGFDALHLPDEKYDYIFSSHTLEHIPDFFDALVYWRLHLKPGGTLFLYLPHPDMLYWHPNNCKKHLHCLDPLGLIDTLSEFGFVNILCSGRDLFWSFAVVANTRIPLGGVK